MATQAKTAVISGLIGALAVGGASLVGGAANGDMSLGTVRCSSARLMNSNMSRAADGGWNAVAQGEAYLVGSQEVGTRGSVQCSGPTWPQLEKNCIAEWRKAHCP